MLSNSEVDELERLIVYSDLQRLPMILSKAIPILFSELRLTRAALDGKAMAFLGAFEDEAGEPGEDSSGLYPGNANDRLAEGVPFCYEERSEGLGEGASAWDGEEEGETLAEGVSEGGLPGRDESECDGQEVQELHDGGAARDDGGPAAVDSEGPKRPAKPKRNSRKVKRDSLSVDARAFEQELGWEALDDAPEPEPAPPVHVEPDTAPEPEVDW